MDEKYCPYCMHAVTTEVCPYCGRNIEYKGSPLHLSPGTVLEGIHPYLFGVPLGQGGFGVTYIARDVTTGERLAIKEYYPTYCASRTGNTDIAAIPDQSEAYEEGKRRFLQEAQTLAKLGDLPSIVHVSDFFEANNTVYLVMEYLEGKTLAKAVKTEGKLSVESFLPMLHPLLRDVAEMHERAVVHRDIAPDNIMILSDGSLRLIDFGSARSYLSDRSMSVMVKRGFSPLEQYMRHGQGSYTDVYALAATIYYCITGVMPPEATERQLGSAKMRSPVELGAKLNAEQEKALEQALYLQPKKRTQTVWLLMEGLYEEESDSESEPEPESIPNPEPIPSPEPKPIPSPMPDMTRTNNQMPTKRKTWTIRIATIAAAVVLTITVVVIGFNGVKKTITSKISEFSEKTSVQELPEETKTSKQEESGSYKRFSYTINGISGIYIGPVNTDNIDNIPHGEGTWTGSDGSAYEGSFVDGVRSGQGTMTIKKSGNTYDTYVGDWASDQKNGEGTYTWAEGDKYEGSFADDVMSGRGTYTWANGNTYVGEWKNDAINGEGTYTWADGDKYEGSFVDGVRSGQGTMTIKKSGNTYDTYVGNWASDKKNGEGTYTWANGDEYVGAWKDDVRNGQGKLTVTDGSIYDGEWANDQYNGQGTMTNKSGDKYVGSFLNGVKSGRGTYTWANGDEYVGAWKDGVRNGQGTMTSKSGDKYVGAWKDGEKSGQGTYTWTNGNKYEGTFVSGEQSKGKMTYANGEKYDGAWKDGKPNGQGTYTWPDGDKYVGAWKDGARSGNGIMTYATGNKYDGEWKNDEPNGQGTFTWSEGDKYVGAWKDGTPNGQGTMTLASGVKYTCAWEAGVPKGDTTIYYLDGTSAKGYWQNGNFVFESIN